MLKDQRETWSGDQPEPASPPAAPEAAAKVCSVPGCTGRYLARNYCIKHYYQVKRHGNVQPEGGRMFPALSRDPEGWRRPLAARRASSPRAAHPREAGCRHGDDCSEALFTQGYCRLHYIMVRSQELLV